MINKEEDNPQICKTPKRWTIAGHILGILSHMIPLYPRCLQRQRTLKKEHEKHCIGSVKDLDGKTPKFMETVEWVIILAEKIILIPFVNKIANHCSCSYGAANDSCRCVSIKDPKSDHSNNIHYLDENDNWFGKVMKKDTVLPFCHLSPIINIINLSMISYQLQVLYYLF